jgi:hypothetical protein
MMCQKREQSKNEIHTIPSMDVKMEVRLWLELDEQR